MTTTLQSPTNNALTRSTEGELAPVESLAPVMTVEQALARYRQLQDVARQLLRENHDFGVIPGTEPKDGKPPRKALLQPGAEKLAGFFGLRPVFVDAGSVKDWESGLFDVRVECLLLRNARREWPDQGGLTGGKPAITGDLVVSVTRSANSREKKFRRGGRVCPSCNAATIMRSKYPEDNPGWYCNGKSGGCGSKFAPDDERILDQTATIDPIAAADLVNTLEGYAQKRALVAAVRMATNASDLFDGDDDNDPTGDDDGERTPAPRKGAKDARTIDEGQWEVIKGWLDHHGLSVRLFLAHFAIGKPRELPVSKEPEAFKLARQGNPAWREARPAAPQKPTGQEGTGDTAHSDPAHRTVAERPGRASAGQVEEIEAELTRAGIAGSDRAELLKRYDVKEPAELFPAQAEAMLVELRDLPARPGQAG